MLVQTRAGIGSRRMTAFTGRLLVILVVVQMVFVCSEGNTQRLNHRVSRQLGGGGGLFGGSGGNNGNPLGFVFSMFDGLRQAFIQFMTGLFNIPTTLPGPVRNSTRTVLQAARNSSFDFSRLIPRLPFFPFLSPREQILEVLQNSQPTDPAVSEEYNSAANNLRDFFSEQQFAELVGGAIRTIPTFLEAFLEILSAFNSISEGDVAIKVA